MSAGGKKYLKIFLGIIFCLLVRLFPFRAPNLEPVLATMMPMSRAFGALAGFSFGAISILAYDLLTGTLGVQTLFTVPAYGLLGLWANRYFRNKKESRFGYVQFAFIGTLFYDAITGLTVGPIFFHQTFWSSLVGQIPFTLLHLVGNMALAFVLSPLIYHMLVRKREKQSATLINTFNPKTI